MTVRLYRGVIGRAWGKPQGMAGDEHYWVPVRDTGGQWFSACGEHRIGSDDNFAGRGHLHLTFERNPLEAARCDACLALYLETDYGKQHGVQSPGWTPQDGEIYPSEEMKL